MFKKVTLIVAMALPLAALAAQPDSAAPAAAGAASSSKVNATQRRQRQADCKQKVESGQAKGATPKEAMSNCMKSG